MDKRFVLIVLLVTSISSVTVSYRIPSAKSIIWIGGHITSDTTWAPVDTYRVINDTSVDLGVTLTILPGVHVQFADGLSLTIEGNLNAIGTDVDPIVFTSSRVSPSAGAWSTVYFKGTSFALEYVKVEYAVNGITIDSQGPARISRSEIFNSSESGIMIKGISNLAIEENTIEYNKHGIATDAASHANMIIVGNTLSLNIQNGIDLYLPAWSYSSSTIHNVTLSSNIISSNAQNGIYFRIDWPYIADVYHVTFSSNIISSNAENGICLYAHTSLSARSIVTISDNRVSANKRTGLHFARIRSNVTANSIAYNQYGVYYESVAPSNPTTGNLATLNDIYSNTVGMDCDSGATGIAFAEYNYWGDSSGPFHRSLNPEGKGNPITGNGVNLDFIPFLTAPQGYINQRPVAVLSVDKTTPNINETVTFDATSSTDDGRIDYYFFDFGDGTNSSWTPLSVVTHKYASEDTYNATLIVMDDFGVTSLDGSLVYEPITVILELPSFLILPLFIAATLLAVIAYKRKHAF